MHTVIYSGATQAALQMTNTSLPVGVLTQAGLWHSHHYVTGKERDTETGYDYFGKCCSTAYAK